MQQVRMMGILMKDSYYAIVSDSIKNTDFLITEIYFFNNRKFSSDLTVYHSTEHTSHSNEH